MSRGSGVVLCSLLGAILGFLAGPAMAVAFHTGCVVNVKGTTLLGAAIGLFLGRLAGRKLLESRLTIGLCLKLIAGFALYLAVFAPYWCYL